MDENPPKTWAPFDYPVGIRGGHGGRSVQFTFEIKLDLDRPGEIFFEGEPFPQDEISLAA